MQFAPWSGGAKLRLDVADLGRLADERLEGVDGEFPEVFAVVEHVSPEVLFFRGESGPIGAVEQNAHHLELRVENAMQTLEAFQEQWHALGSLPAGHDG